MTLNPSSLPEAPAKSWSPPQNNFRKIYNAALIFTLVIQGLAIVCQIVHLYFHFESGVSMLEKIMEIALISHFAIGGLLATLIQSLILNKQLIARLWNKANSGRFTNSSLTKRSLLFSALWGTIMSLSMLKHIALAPFSKGILLLVVEVFIRIGLFMVSALILLKVSTWKRRFLGCLTYCSLTLLLNLMDFEKGFLPIEVLPKLGRNDKTEELFKLAERHHLDPDNIKEGINLDNAFYTRTFLREKIIIGDKMHSKFGDKEAAAVMAHELGHRENGDLWTRVFISLDSMALWNIFTFIILPVPEVYAAFGFETEPVVAALAIRDAFSWVFDSSTTIFTNFLYQLQEFAADQHAVEMGYGEALIQFLQRSSVNKTGNKFFELVYLSHPSNERRIAAIKN